MKTKKQNQRIIPITPEWQSFFELAKQIAKEQIATDSGQAVVIEMLEYGQRLDKIVDYRQNAKEVASENARLRNKLRTTKVSDLDALADQ